MLQNSYYAILGTFYTLLNNTDLYLSYFILSYVFLGHNDSVEWGLTVPILCFFWLKIVYFFLQLIWHCDLQYTLGLIHKDKKLRMNGLFWWALEISYEWQTTWWYFTASLYCLLEQLDACYFMRNIKLGASITFIKRNKML